MQESDIQFERYIDLAEARRKLGDAPTADELLAEVVLPAIKEITSVKQKHDVIIWDTWRIVYQSARGHVERNKARYKDVVDWTRGTSIMIQGLVSKVARMIEVKQLNELKASSELLIITHHIKDHYLQNVVVGKIPESSNTFSEVCNMRLWLRRNPRSKVPIILFLKRPNMPKIKNGVMQFVNVVPLKITPTDKDNSIWDAIARYEANPIESRKPTEDETPTAEEFAAISGTLTTEQRQYAMEMMKYQKEVEESLMAVSPGDTITVPPNAELSNVPANGGQAIARAISELKLTSTEIEEALGVPISEIANSYTPHTWKMLLAYNKQENSNAKEKKTKR
jgi:hypothetical protein